MAAPSRAVMPSSQGSALAPTLSQAELDALVDGVSFDDDLSFETDGCTPTKQDPRTCSPSRQSPKRVRSPTAQVSGRATPPQLTRTPLASTSRLSGTATVLTLGSSSPLCLSSSGYQARLLSSSAARSRRDVDERDDPLPAPPPDDGFFDQISAAIDQAGMGSAEDVELIELSSDSEVEIAPIRFTRGKENAAPSPGLLKRPPPPLASATVARAELKKTAAGTKKATRTFRGKHYEKDLAKAAEQAKFALANPTFDYAQWPAKPKLVYTYDEVVVSKTLARMKGPLGFDLEWEPYSFNRQPGKTALAQVCDEHTILLVHVARMSTFSPSLRKLVQDPTRIKLGVQISGDAQKLVRDGFVTEPSGMLELNNVAKAVDSSHYAPGRYGLVGLQALVRKYLDKYLPKDPKVRQGKWASALGEEQRKYAANDVYSSLMVHLELAGRAPEGVDVTDFASGLSLRKKAPAPAVSATGSVTEKTPKVGERIAFTASEGVVERPKKVARASPTRGEPTPRQMEAYKLWHGKKFTVQELTKHMSAIRPIREISAIWSVLGALQHHSPPLPYDPVRLLAAVDEVQSPSKVAMLAEHAELLDRMREEVSKLA